MLSALVAILRSPAHSRTPVVDGQAARRSHHIHNGYYSNKNASTPPRGQTRVVIQKLYMITQNNFPYKICMAKSATHFHLFHSRIRFLHLFLAFLLLKRTTVSHNTNTNTAMLASHFLVFSVSVSFNIFSFSAFFFSSRRC